MKFRIESTDKDFIYDFIIKYVREDKKEKYKVPVFDSYIENGEEWYRFYINDIDIKLK